ncbi:hypothetical protein F1C10_11040 [Sphingomonas sp. NBWT7]|uniref:hypothetical protein n=1 Tax=Sphingomonas sp. NBWT7 TaxID=2596913 RepID=UPI0016249A1F|nr:hypothetical protein [Sphingomonas sp. NBWT7]QNE32426.1 hypothetical protein F1C10_11040 [Sphingomonas sp. NBWT7]
MKKIVIAALAATTAFASPALAQSGSFGSSGTDSTPLRATIAAVCTIDAPAGGSLTVGTADQAIGNTAAQCNDPDGFTATIASANGGVLKGTGNNTQTIAYTMTIANVPSATNLSLANQYTFTQGGEANAVAGYTLPTTVTVENPAIAFADDYSDTITFSIVAQ